MEGLSKSRRQRPPKLRKRMVEVLCCAISVGVIASCLAVEEEAFEDQARRAIEAGLTDSPTRELRERNPEGFDLLLVSSIRQGSADARTTIARLIFSFEIDSIVVFDEVQSVLSSDASEIEKEFLVRSLRNFEDSSFSAEAQRILQVYLASESDILRSAAARAAFDICNEFSVENVDPETLRGLLRLQHDRDPDIRDHVARIVCYVGDRHVPQYDRIIAEEVSARSFLKDENPGVVRLALQADILFRGDMDCPVSLIVPHLSDRVEGLEFAAMDRLASLAPDLVPGTECGDELFRLFGEADRESQELLYFSMLRGGAEAGLAAKMELRLCEKFEPVRQRYEWARSFSLPDAKDALEICLASRDDELIRGALDSLSRTEDPNAFLPLVRYHMHHSSPEVRRDALHCLRNMTFDVERLVGELREITRDFDKTSDERWIAAETLRRLERNQGESVEPGYETLRSSAILQHYVEASGEGKSFPEIVTGPLVAYGSGYPSVDLTFAARELEEKLDPFLPFFVLYTHAPDFPLFAMEAIHGATFTLDEEVRRSYEAAREVEEDPFRRLCLEAILAK